MKITTLLFLIISISSANFLNAQEKSYQGLLWEISGNGLNTPSYLYGTMHVSNKLAFNVSDSFYLCLNNAEGIALESSPANWMEDYREMGAFTPQNFGYGKDFYQQAFNINSPESAVIYNLLQNKNGLMNQILYRYRPGNDDYEENTFLDMFIYQAGAKNAKSIYSLETLDEVIDLSVKSMTPDKEKKRENTKNSLLEKDRQHKYVLLEDAYRRGDLNQIDSLSKTDNPTSVYHKYFIVERNKNMVRRIDSIVNSKSLFIGVGAAHLPGDEGMIELLRNEGFTVRSVTSKSSNKSHKMRKKLEALYKSIPFQEEETIDDFMKVSVPGELYEMPTGKVGRMEYLCPEPINGGYYNVIRQFTLGPIFNKDPEFYQKSLDSLLYIATPGELIKKEDIEVNGYKGYNILTKTSKNAFVNYNVFFTPTEIVVLKGFGLKDYILKSGPKSFFSKLSLAPSHSNWTTVTPEFGGAEWQMKGLVTGQDLIPGLEDSGIDPFYQSYDQSTKNYYMAMRYTLNDLDYIEEDSFDLAYLGEQFAERLGYDIASTDFSTNKGYANIRQELKIKDKYTDRKSSLYINLITERGQYYLMCSTTNDADGEKFFNSFKLTDYKLDQPYEEYEDTVRFYTVQTIKKKEAKTFGGGYDFYRNNNQSDEDETYKGSTSSNFHNEPRSGEDIYVGYSKFHNYDGADSLAAFWDYRKKKLIEDNDFILSREKHKELDNGHQLSFLLSDTGSAKGIMTQLVAQHGVLYTMQALIDTVKGPSEYVQTFFETFNPMDTMVGRNIFEDKADVFFEHVNSTDSLLKVNAMKSIESIDFKEKDIEKLVEVYHNFEFDEKQEALQRENLIHGLGNVEDQKAYDFLFSVFDENNFNADLQFAVLHCFSFTETEEAYAAIKKLLLENPPFTNNQRKLNFFDNLYDSLELAKDYFPEMLDLVQYADYNPYVLELLAEGYLDSVFPFDNFKSEKNSIYRNAKIELKRMVAAQKKIKSEDKYNRDYTLTNQYGVYHNLLMDYYTLMCGFKVNGNEDVDVFFKDIDRIENNKFLLEAEIIHHQLGLPVDTAKINQVANDLDYRQWVYNRLEDEELLTYFPEHISQQDMAEAILYNNNLDDEKDTIVFLKKLEVDNGKEKGFIYFFKRKNDDNLNWMIDYVGLLPISDEKLIDGYFEKKLGFAVQNEEEIELTIDKTIEYFELQHRKRVKTNTGYGNYEDFYGMY